uniref:alpha-amylase n=1 Tax=Denticeps clupeoides TaxID=299321 RepID=A0AAY4D663_9TELE
SIVFVLLHFCGQVNSRLSIVHLFEWRWLDIAEECERYLAPCGFDAVQISPPNESIVVEEPHRPWWERYQPISYKLCSRSGTEQELRDMISRCNSVKIYADVVINHMCASSGGGGRRSTCGSYFNASKEEFPSVPYSTPHFNDDKCTSASGNIENYQDIYQRHVRDKVAEYMNSLIGMGVANIRVAGGPQDHSKSHTLKKKEIFFFEVIDLGGEPVKCSEYFGHGHVTEFKYGAVLGAIICRWNGDKLQVLYCRTWRESCALIGHGAGGASILTFWEPRLYRMAVAFMLARPYGVTRVMSSYRWDRQIAEGEDQNNWMGLNVFHASFPTFLFTFRNMVAFCNIVDGQPLVNWWDNGENQIAFGHGDRGFIVINKDVCMAAGVYCDVISGQQRGRKCTGKRIAVGLDGRARFTIKPSEHDPLIAIHTESKL